MRLLPVRSAAVEHTSQGIDAPGLDGPQSHGVTDWHALPCCRRVLHRVSRNQLTACTVRQFLCLVDDRLTCVLGASDYWSTSMHSGAGGANDLDGSEIHDIGLDGQAVADMEASWVATMDVVKQAILDANGFTWQMMVNNGHGSGSALWCAGVTVSPF